MTPELKKKGISKSPQINPSPFRSPGLRPDEPYHKRVLTETKEDEKPKKKKKKFDIGDLPEIPKRKPKKDEVKDEIVKKVGNSEEEKAKEMARKARKASISNDVLKKFLK
mmetsp:Transcript_1084/g.961  ORF Transcript_1084/g.961 Transcript_1084/m.961 type:complete len:110 (+) Transcript_1084:1893-2222(+)